MVVDPSPLALRARWVFPVDGAPIAGGVVSMLGERIVAVGRAIDGAARDLGDVAILPGLVNAHTHLEFSDLPAPLAAPGIALPDWIPHVVAHRRASTAAPDAIIAAGLAESIAAGVTALGEIATEKGTGVFFSQKQRFPSPLLTVFREWIGPTRGAAAKALSEADMFLELVSKPVPRGTVPFCSADSAKLGQSPAVSKPVLADAGALVRPALSPHAPYTVHPELLAGLVELGRRFDVPLAMHLAESREELELLATGAGPFREMLERLGAWDAARDARYPRIGDYLEQLARAPRSLVVHGNYLTDAEARFLAEHAEWMSVVYCPRTHDFFRHAPYPLAERLAAGVSMALGTDSRASNPNLSLLEEMRFVAVGHPHVAPRTVLELGTRCGARALGLASEMGTITGGKWANFAIVGPIEASPGDPHELVLAPGTGIVQTWLRGKRVYDAALTAGNS